jgi:hypothetical protein
MKVVNCVVSKPNPKGLAGIVMQLAMQMQIGHWRLLYRDSPAISGNLPARSP